MENPQFTLLAVDDDATQLELLRVICEKIEFPSIEYLSAETGTQGLETVKSRSVDLVLTDYRLPDINGLEVLKRIKADNPLVSVVVMTAFEDARDCLAGFAELVKSPEHIHTYRISPLSLWNAAAAGQAQEGLLGRLILAGAQVAREAGIEESGYRLVLNVGPDGGESVPHLHLHVIPRYQGDMEEPKGGVRGVIPEKRGY